jgi:hypothetical protein
MEIQRLLVLSDTHGQISDLEAVLNWAKDSSLSGGINTAVFLGDGISDLQRGARAAGFSCEWKLVRGNNDSDFSIPLSNAFDFNGHRFFFCHGHRSSLFNGFQTILAAAKNVNAQAALFGHTHVPYCKKVDDILLINPGSVGMPRTELGATFATVACEPGKPLEVEFWLIGSRGYMKKIKFP